MKISRFIGTIAIISLLCIISSCKQEHQFRIGVSQCSDDDWRSKMNGEMEREMMFHPEAVLEIRSADDNNSKQISDVEYFLKNKVDILIVAPNEADALTPVIKKVYESGIPVIVFDRNIKGNYYTAFQGASNEEIGSYAAMHLRSKYPGETKILEIYGLAGSTPAKERHDGFVKTLEENNSKFELTTIESDWTYEDALPKVMEELKKNPKVDVIYAHNDRMAIAASDASNGLNIKPYIIGIDAAPEIGLRAVKDGKIDATFFYPTEGAQIIKTAIAILNNEPFDSVFIMPSAPPVTIDNVDILLKQQEELDTETGHLEVLKQELDDYWRQHSAQSMLLVLAIVIILLSFVVIFIVIRSIWVHKQHHYALSIKNSQLEKQKEELEEQKEELVSLNRQLEEATQSKLVFFTNVSHDLRTPLTLISEPVNQLSKSSNLTDNQKSLIKIAEKNIKILRRLINQILDFRKYENNRLELNLVEVDIARAIADWVSAFEPVARQRHIELTSRLEQSMVMAVDVEKIERVFFNLVSNAFKYSPDNSKIEVECLIRDEMAEITVRDTGKGISNEDVKNVFDRFFQVDKVHPTGSGIGLSLAKAFVEMHGGKITVESKLGVGSTFSVTLPIRHVAEKPVENVVTITSKDIESELDIIDLPEIMIDAEKPVLLAIDDNEDILNLVGRLLGDEYNILTANNGKDGLKMASKYIPDVIICDVMMPIMDGLECTRKLKEEVSTSHIPILMLTACSMDEQRIQGLESGADAYIAKPFNIEILNAQLRNLIKNRAIIKNIAGNGLVNRNTEIKHQEEKRDVEKLRRGASAVDNEFYQRFVSLVEKNMDDPELNVDRLATEMGFARSQFYRKMKALTNYSPVELLRQMRLKRARQLLTTTEKSISQVGYEVGFASAAYFSKCFHDEFGETPSQLRERLGH